jgi:hypothetical protein
MVHPPAEPRTLSPSSRQQIQKLLAEEEAKERAAATRAPSAA